MNATVPVLSVVCMIIELSCGILFPLFLFLLFRRKYHCKGKAFWVGCGVMFLFALVLEQIVHALVLNSPAGTVIIGNIWLYAVYGGLMAGLFEETGRLAAFSTLLKKDMEKDENALMYGAGHGGFEAFYLLTFGMINNLVYTYYINTGKTDQLTANLSDAALAQVQSAIDALVSTGSYVFLLGIAERISAIILQLSFSVIVWFGVKYRKKAYYFLAIALHMLVDAVTVLLSKSISNLILMEAVIFVLAILIAFFAVKIWKKQKDTVQAEVKEQS